ncbi:MAG: hypothetical protein Q9222_007162 [Ikaeria aurantiellina]
MPGLCFEILPYLQHIETAVLGRLHTDVCFHDSPWDPPDKICSPLGGFHRSVSHSPNLQLRASFESTFAELCDGPNSVVQGTANLAAKIYSMQSPEGWFREAAVEASTEQWMQDATYENREVWMTTGFATVQLDNSNTSNHHVTSPTGSEERIFARQFQKVVSYWEDIGKDEPINMGLNPGWNSVEKKNYRTSEEQEEQRRVFVAKLCPTSEWKDRLGSYSKEELDGLRTAGVQIWDEICEFNGFRFSVRSPQRKMFDEIIQILLR